MPDNRIANENEKAMHSSENSVSGTGDPTVELLISRAVRLNVIIMGLTIGAGAGLGLFFGTQLSLALYGDNAGNFLNLLGVFFPGYSASPGGAWAGLLWGFVIGGFSGSYGYWLYSRNARRRFAEMTVQAETSGQLVDRPTAQLSGQSLGLAFGSLLALQLFLTTMWLVVRGTGDSSPHADLLSNYLPGYSVTFVGALIGCLEIFVFTYVFAWIFAGIYNVVAARGTESRV